MNDKIATGVHWSFWVVGAFALFWNIGGSINYFMQMDPEMISAYRESERAIIIDRPAWATAGFAIGVFGDALACVLLLLRKSTAFYLFLASLLGVIVTMVHTVSVDYDFSVGEMVVFILMPLLVAAFLVWYSKYAERKGWLITQQMFNLK
jgi:hypothetical protein